MPVSQLKDGIDFSRLIGIPGQPIDIWIKKTWWSGLYIKATLKSNGKPLLVFDNNQIIFNASNGDVNYDDYAFEVVSSDAVPEFQLIISEDYSTIYINARLVSGDQSVIIKKGGIYSVTTEEAKKPEYKLDRIFKYPSYIHLKQRD